jgi:urea carboxylase
MEAMVSDGDNLMANQVAVVLEAMKLEISVKVDAALDGMLVQKVLVQPRRCSSRREFAVYL